MVSRERTCKCRCRVEIIFAFVSVFIVGCRHNDGDSANAEVDTIPPMVLSVSPTLNAADISRRTAIEIVFSEDLLRTSVNDSVVTLEGDGKINGVATYDSSTDTLAFIPDRLLSAETSYTVTVSGDVADVAGNTLVGSFSWSFTTASRTWWPAKEVCPSCFDSHGDSSPQMAFMDTGVGVIVWFSASMLGFDLRSSFYEPLLGWKDLANVASLPFTDTGNYERPQVAVDDSGNTTLVWEWGDSSPYNTPPYSIYADRYNVETSTWSGSQLIETDEAGPASSPSVVMDSEGNAIAVWAQSDGTQNNIMYNIYNVETGWSAMPLAIDNLDSDARSPDIDIGGENDLLAVWFQADNVWSNHYKPTGEWEIPIAVGPASLNNVGDDLTVSVGETSAVAAWEAGLSNAIWARVYSLSANAWLDAAVQISPVDGSSTEPDSAIDGFGKAMVVWRQEFNGTRILSSHYVPGSGWSAPQRVDTHSDGDVLSPLITADRAGNMTVVWPHISSPNDTIWARRYLSDTGNWGEPKMLGPFGASLGGSYCHTRPNRCMAISSANDDITVAWVGAFGSGRVVDRLSYTRFE